MPRSPNLVVLKSLTIHWLFPFHIFLGRIWLISLIWTDRLSGETLTKYTTGSRWNCLFALLINVCSDSMKLLTCFIQAGSLAWRSVLARSITRLLFFLYVLFRPVIGVGVELLCRPRWLSGGPSIMRPRQIASSQTRIERGGGGGDEYSLSLHPE